jgi:hypothetical protein
VSQHKIISFVKSSIRLCGYGIAAYAFKELLPIVWVAFTILAIAEVVGIVEEFGEK